MSRARLTSFVLHSCNRNLTRLKKCESAFKYEWNYVQHSFYKIKLKNKVLKQRSSIWSLWEEEKLLLVHACNIPGKTYKEQVALVMQRAGWLEGQEKWRGEGGEILLYILLNKNGTIYSSELRVSVYVCQTRSLAIH